jgi:hypothetical protein
VVTKAGLTVSALAEPRNWDTRVHETNTFMVHLAKGNVSFYHKLGIRRLLSHFDLLL